MGQKVSLLLSNGKQYNATLIGAPLLSSGELVFTTSTVAYNEAITDPSFFGQVLIFSYPDSYGDSGVYVRYPDFNSAFYVYF